MESVDPWSSSGLCLALVTVDAADAEFVAPPSRSASIRFAAPSTPSVFGVGVTPSMADDTIPNPDPPSRTTVAAAWLRDDSEAVEELQSCLATVEKDAVIDTLAAQGYPVVAGAYTAPVASPHRLRITPVFRLQHYHERHPERHAFVLDRATLERPGSLERHAELVTQALRVYAHQGARLPGLAGVTVLASRPGGAVARVCLTLSSDAARAFEQPWAITDIPSALARHADIHTPHRHVPTRFPTNTTWTCPA